MAGVTNYAAYYQMQNKSSLLSAMMPTTGKKGVAATSMFTDLAAANNQKLSNIMEKNATTQALGYNDYKTYEKDATAFKQGFNSVMGDLKSSSQKLMQYSSSSVTNPVGYGSKNGSVASVSSDNSDSSVVKEPIQLSVTQVAQKQTTQTNEIKTSGKDLGGASSIKLTSADNKTSVKLDFKFSYSTDNKTALNEMAAKINSSKMGVTASIVEKDGKSSLSIVSASTGKDAGFKAEITGAMKNNVTLKTTQTAQDAIYSINGGEQKTSAVNDIKVADNKVSVTLKSAGSTTLERAQKDNTGIVDAAKQFASDYNRAVDFLGVNKSKSNAIKNLSASFETMKFSATKMSEIGINVDSKGRMKVDANRLTAALEKTPDKVKDILSGKDGAANIAYQKAVAAKSNERNLYPPTAQMNQFNSISYNKNMTFLSQYMNGNFMNTII